jgi:hypothetical protein
MVLFLYKLMFLALLPFLNTKTAVEKGPVNLPHPFYVSVTEINHNASTKSLEISCKFFAEDLEQILEKDYKTQLDITAAKDKAAFDKDIPDYVSKRLSLTVDGKPVALHYIGFEKDKESAYAYFEVENISSVKSINANNSLLHDFIDQQINIMHVVVGGKRQSTKLDYPETKAAFSF